MLDDKCQANYICFQPQGAYDSPNGITIEFLVNILGCVRSIIASWAMAYKKLRQCLTYPVGISTNHQPLNVYTVQLRGMESSREPASRKWKGYSSLTDREKPGAGHKPRVISSPFLDWHKAPLERREPSSSINTL